MHVAAAGLGRQEPRSPARARHRGRAACRSDRRSSARHLLPCRFAINNSSIADLVRPDQQAQITRAHTYIVTHSARATRSVAIQHGNSWSNAIRHGFVVRRSIARRTYAEFTPASKAPTATATRYFMTTPSSSPHRQQANDDWKRSTASRHPRCRLYRLVRSRLSLLLRDDKHHHIPAPPTPT